MVLYSWMAVPGLVPELEIIQVLWTKTVCTGNLKGKGVERLEWAPEDEMAVGSSA